MIDIPTIKFQEQQRVREKEPFPNGHYLALFGPEVLFFRMGRGYRPLFAPDSIGQGAKEQAEDKEQEGLNELLATPDRQAAP